MGQRMQIRFIATRDPQVQIDPSGSRSLGPSAHPEGKKISPWSRPGVTIRIGGKRACVSNADNVRGNPAGGRREVAVDVFIVAGVRLYRQGLASALDADGRFRIVGTAAGHSDGLA